MANWWDAAPKASPLDVALAAESVDPKVADIARSIYQQESGSGKNTKTSNAGAVGGMQIIPATFASVADKDWDINNPEQNARAGVRYIKQLYDKAGGDPVLTAVGYYGGPGGMEKARRGIAVSDPRNPKAPNTLEYGKQVASRVLSAVVPSANAATPEFGEWWAAAPVVEAEKPKAEPAKDEPGFLQNLGVGAIRGAANIGATILAPIDAGARALGIQNDWIGRTDRRQKLDQFANENADTGSLAYQGGKLGAEIAGTAPVGGILGGAVKAAAPAVLGARAVPAANALATALETGGFRIGQNVANPLASLAIRGIGGAATGAASAGLVNPSDAAMGAAIGGSLPVGAKLAGAGGNALRRMVVGEGASPEVSALAKRAAELGIDIPADRVVNSKPLNALASALNYVPFSGRAATETAMERQTNRALSRTFGQDSDNVTMALRKASDELGAKFDDVLKSNTVKVDEGFLSKLAEIADSAQKELGSDGVRIIENQIDELMAKGATGEIDGQAAYNIKRTLDRIGRRSTPEAYQARQIKGALMEALDRSLGPDAAKAFATTRKQYGNMLALENLAQNGAEGGISVARLANMKNINNPDLQELADIAAQFIKAREGQHGSMQRAAAALGVGGSLGLPALAGVSAGGRAANVALNSNALRDLMLQPRNPLLGEAPMGLITQGVRRTAPLLIPGEKAQ